MSNAYVGKSHLLGAKLSFLMMSFIISIIAFTVKNDIWPFLQTSLPMQEDYKTWSLFAIFFGLVAPGVWLLIDWNNKLVRYSLFSILIMFILQLSTEYVVAHYFFISMIIPTCILYVGYRIIQFTNLLRFVNKANLNTGSRQSKFIRTWIIIINLIFWSIFWIKLSFYIFPRIIYQIF